MHFAEQMDKGNLVLLDNETIKLKVEMISATTLTCKIERGGFLGSYKDVFVPNVTFDMPNYSEHDKEYIDMAIHMQVSITYVTVDTAASTASIKILTKLSSVPENTHHINMYLLEKNCL